MPSAMVPQLVHQALLYDSPEDFVAVLAPFARAGLERGDMVFAATKPANAAALLEELGDDGGRVEVHNTFEWLVRPFERLQAFRQLVDALPPRVGLTAMGEPVWTGSDAVIRQWARYESIINLALADAPMRFVCLYDSSALPDRILDYAVGTHPSRVEDGTTVPSPGFVAPEDFLPEAPATPPDGVESVSVETPSAFRRLVGDRAVAAGLPRARASDLVLAANEVVTNAFRHGLPPVRAAIWVRDDELVCRVADRGPAISDPLAGWLPPAPDANGGWGLSIARRLCDAIDVTSHDDGNVVSLHVSLQST